MILWISGAYGVGKSTLAEKLQTQLQGSMLFDAEELGNVVRSSYPDCPYGYIFEDYPLWAEFCVRLLSDIHQRFQRTLIVPMTLLRLYSYSQILQPLKNCGIDTRLIVLNASFDTIHDRILARGEDEDCWCMKNAPLAIAGSAALPADLFLTTDGRSVDSLASEVCSWLHCSQA